MKVHIVGDVGVGKTSLIHFLENRLFEENYISTINYTYHDVIHDRIHFEIWDSPIEEKYNVDYRMSQLVLIVFDVTNPNTFTNACFWYNNIRDKSNVPILFIANKCDLPTENRYKDTLDKPCLNISLKTGYNCDKISLKILDLFESW